MGKTIRLENLEGYLINLDEQHKRREDSQKIFDRCGMQNIKRFSGIKHPIGVVGCGMSHLAILNNLQPGEAIFEDDIGITSWYKDKLQDLPDCDALYLGVSNHGYVRTVRGGVAGTVLASQHDENYKQVFNMCGTHAIVYLSQEYIDAVRKMIVLCLETSYPFDLGIAQIHKDFKVLTPNNPLFYQTEQENFTNFTLGT